MGSSAEEEESILRDKDFSEHPTIRAPSIGTSRNPSHPPAPVVHLSNRDPPTVTHEQTQQRSSEGKGKGKVPVKPKTGRKAESESDSDSDGLPLLTHYKRPPIDLTSDLGPPTHPQTEKLTTSKGKEKEKVPSKSPSLGKQLRSGLSKFTNKVTSSLSPKAQAPRRPDPRNAQLSTMSPLSLDDDHTAASLSDDDSREDSGYHTSDVWGAGSQSSDSESSGKTSDLSDHLDHQTAHDLHASDLDGSGISSTGSSSD